MEEKRTMSQKIISGGQTWAGIAGFGTATHDSIKGFIRQILEEYNG
jgi:hypothetical protein